MDTEETSLNSLEAVEETMDKEKEADASRSYRGKGSNVSL